MQLVVSIIRERIKEDDCSGGFNSRQPARYAAPTARDGAAPYVPNRPAALGSPSNIAPLAAAAFAATLAASAARSRWVHKASGRSYHVKFAKPKSLKEGDKPSEETMLDDESGEPLMQRADDTEEALSQRLESYHAQTVPILDHYAPSGVVQKVNANVAPDQVWESIVKVLPSA